MKPGLLKAMVVAIETPVIVCVVIVFLLLALAHWIDDEWIDHGSN